MSFEFVWVFLHLRSVMYDINKNDFTHDKKNQFLKETEQFETSLISNQLSQQNFIYNLQNLLKKNTDIWIVS